MGGTCFELRKKSEKQESHMLIILLQVYFCYVLHLMMSYRTPTHGIYIYTIWWFNIAMENGPFIDGLPINNGDFPWLC